MADETIIHRRGTTTQWNSPTKGPLKDGEWGLNTTTREAKMGDGSTAFASLPLPGGGGGGGTPSDGSVTVAKIAAATLVTAAETIAANNNDTTIPTSAAVTGAVTAGVASKAPLASPAFTGTPTGITKTHVGLGNVDNLQQQPLDTNLTTVAGLTPTTNNFLQAKSSAWSSRTPTQVTADLIAFVGDSGSGGTKGLVPAPGVGDATKLLRGDGTWVVIGGGGDALVANPLSQFALTTSAQLRGVLSDETGTGAAVFATSPTLVTPVLGTPTSATLTNATGLPVSGIAASTVTALGVGSVELGHASDTTVARSGAGDITIEGNAVYRAGGTDVPVADGGTGRSTSTTAYGLIAAGTTATGAHQTLAAGATTEVLVGGGAAALPAWTTATGSGAPVRATSPALVTPTGIVKGDVGLGNVDNTSNATERAAVRTLTNAAIAPRVNTTTSSATPAINVDTTDLFTITALAAAITSMTSGLTGTPVNGQKLLIRIKDNATARAITWGASFVSSGVATLLATTVISKTHLVGFIYDSTAAVWVCVAVDAAGY